MTENQFGPRGDEADDQTRVTYPQQAGSSSQPLPQGFGQQPPSAPPATPAAPPAQHSGYPAPQPQQGYAPYQGVGFGPEQGRQGGTPGPREKAGYFRSLFDLSYDNLGAPKFARVFQLLFMIVSGLAVLIVIARSLGFGSFIPLVLAVIVGPLLWLLLNTLVRLILEAVVGIVQTAENSEEMLSILRQRDRA